MITGINGYICEDCAAQAYQIVQEQFKEKDGSSGKGKASASQKVPKPREIKD